jgi:hypothetical protein
VAVAPLLGATATWPSTARPSSSTSSPRPPCSSPAATSCSSLLLLPVVGVGAALLGVHGELGDDAARWILPVAAGTLVLPVAVRAACPPGRRRAREGRVLELLSPGEVGLALECGGYGLAAALLVAFPLLDALGGRPAPRSCRSPWRRCSSPPGGGASGPRSARRRPARPARDHR